MLVLITGGQRSGKSRLAEKLLAEHNAVVYFATAEYNDSDTEMSERIKKHQSRRNPAWRTVECYKQFYQFIEQDRSYLLDCVTNSVSRLLFDYTHDKECLHSGELEILLSQIKKEYSLLIETAKAKNANIYFVTNEVGSAVIPMHPISRAFVDLQGMINAFIAENCDAVYLCVSGIPIKIK
ncbi:MAG: bifunctional adenosylcobinamide kinase/adenosylcobinamide-phosphate guanylyltransferase [Spirochaetaceae bacterium]|nr:bifunctional adenosylcobinamide kinase/adenosylcobinamide-phosphate guanylyltransferase [Spirochaetaceae bacterium]